MSLKKNILDLLNRKTLLGFVRALEPDQTNLWPSLFPFKGTDDLKASYVVGAYGAPVVMNAHSWESEAELGSRGAFSEKELELIKFARKMRLNEEEIRKTLQPRTGTSDADAAIRAIYDDSERLTNDADITREKMALEVVSTGQLAIRGMSCDFLVPSEQKITLTGEAKWDQPTTRDILQNELDWINLLVNSGKRRPTRSLTTTPIFNLMLQDQKYREAYWGKPIGAVQPPALSPEQVRQVRSSYRLPEVRTYDRYARIQNDNGAYTNLQLLASDRYILLPDGPIGQMLHGVTTEALMDSDLQGAERQGLYIYNTVEEDPPAMYTKASMLAVPTAPEAQHLLIAVVK